MPLPKGDPSTGAVEKGEGGATNAVKPQTPDTVEKLARNRTLILKSKGKDTDQTNPAGPGTR